jgi:glycosyltransferase involved in cell wall biosynthesis
VTPLPLTATDLPYAPFVSVIMNCYNSARYLRAALESVKAQTFGNWEIIFWDNRSTDESATIFKSFDDPRFRYILAPEHTVLGKAKGLAIERARGEWLAFLDCDDLWLPDKLERQVAIIAEEGTDLGLVYGHVENLVEEEARATDLGRRLMAFAALNRGYVKSLPEGFVFADLLKENFVTQPSVMVRCSAYSSAGGINPALRHSWDYDLSLKVSKRFRARALQQVCCYYRVHVNNLSHAHAVETYLEAIDIVESYLPARAAARGLRVWNTVYAANLLKNREYRSAFFRLLKGDIMYFFKMGCEHVFRRARLLLTF